mmetsp:Transcript_24551/g.41771  ORF Transcript_24551/g.41771 Transcript_24551/m.41771 type:complete len:726 (-) Transcript_24551:92-2269(-)
MMQEDSAKCVHCGHSTPDVRILGCAHGCCFHARCLDLKSIRELTPPSSDICVVSKCPRCASPSTGMEILPLSFEEIDQARRLVGASGSSSKRSFGVVNSGGAQTGGGDVYDPAVPRAGKWAEEEIAFRDNLVTHFVSGSLPLPNELKLCEFLSKILKSKPSRLTKKMKNANLSTRHFVGNSAYIEDVELARELSRLELRFVNSIVEPVERSEIKFHMQREWRDYLAALCTVLNIRFEATEWLKSIENMENRIALATTRDRSVKRRLMMGKAIETDACAAEAMPGVFIDHSQPHEEIDFDLLASAIETNDYDDTDFRNLYLSLVDDPAPSTSATVSDNSSQRSSDDPTQSSPQKSSVARKGLLMSSAAPNFKFAAPFLARAASYIEHNQLPFEHIDIWVPTMTTSLDDPSGATSLQPCLGSGALNIRPGRLCFAGSYSLDVHMVNDPQTSTLKKKTLSQESVYNLLLFGSYSEKFSFSSGCGLPGRVYESAVPAWEQFITNAPSHLFERRGGAMQFGIKTALGLPIESTNVGRIVLVMYSTQDREKDDYLVANIISDLQKLNPCPRWKLVVDMGSGGNDTAPQSTSHQLQAPSMQSNQSEFNEADIIKSSQIKELISILGENMPSDYSSPLGQQINDIMSLRLVLLNSSRSPDEEQLVDSILLLFGSYLKAGRSRADISQMVTRDYAFHSTEHQRNQQQQVEPRHRVPSFSNQLQHLSINSGSPRF